MPKKGPPLKLQAAGTNFDNMRSSPESGSDLEGDLDSGYCSFSDAADESADFYDDLLARFREEGPTLVNHSENTRNMTKEQERKWTKYLFILPPHIRVRNADILV
jgi:hypothetical protein